jgi:hypothetical protein
MCLCVLLLCLPIILGCAAVVVTARIVVVVGGSVVCNVACGMSGKSERERREERRRDEKNWDFSFLFYFERSLFYCLWHMYMRVSEREKEREQLLNYSNIVVS